jgi:hypothetical protein
VAVVPLLVAVMVSVIVQVPEHTLNWQERGPEPLHTMEPSPTVHCTEPAATTTSAQKVLSGPKVLVQLSDVPELALSRTAGQLGEAVAGLLNVRGTNTPMSTAGRNGFMGDASVGW